MPFHSRPGARGIAPAEHPVVSPCVSSRLTMRLAAAVVLATTAAGSLVASATARTSDDWLQYAHDAAHTSSTDVPRLGPLEVVGGWPADCAFCTNGAVTGMVRVGGQPTRAVFSGTNFITTLYGFDRAGVTLPGKWPVQLGPPAFASLATPAVYSRADVTGIFTADQFGGIFAVDATGAALPGWPVHIDGDAEVQGVTLVEEQGEPVLYADVFQGGDPQIPQILELHALTLDGRERPGWPLALDIQEDGFSHGNYAGGPAVSPDGSVYFVGGRALHAALPDGSYKPGWPFRFPRYAITRLTAPAVGSDGTVYMGVVQCGGNLCGDQASAILYALSPTGDVEQGWPVRVPGRTYGAPAVGKDGTLYYSIWRELTGGMQRSSVYALTPGGEVKPGWPVNVDTPYAGPPERAIEGLALDRQDDVYFAVRDTVYGFDSNGEPLAGWPFEVQGTQRLQRIALANDGTVYLTEVWGADGDRLYALRGRR